MIVYYSAAATHSNRINDGPRDHLDDYFDSIRKIETAIAYFEENTADSPEYPKLITLKNKALRELEVEFEALLRRESISSTREELEGLETSNKLLDTTLMLSTDVIQILQRILTYMVSINVPSELIHSYAKVRGSSATLEERQRRRA